MASGLLTGAMTRERAAKVPDDDWRKHSPEFREPDLSKDHNSVAASQHLWRGDDPPFTADLANVFPITSRLAAHLLRVWKEPRTLRSHVRRRIGLSSVITGLAKNSDFQADSAVSVVKHRKHAGLPSPTDKQDPKLRSKSLNGKPAHHVTSPVRLAPLVRALEHQIHSV
jgi:hypothetical protein